jgi:hypothetical protein
MTDNVVIAIVSVAGVVITAVCVLGGAIFAYIASNKRLSHVDTKLDDLAAVKTKAEVIDTRLDGLDKTMIGVNMSLSNIHNLLQVIQNDMKLWSEQIYKIKAHVKLD